VACDELRESEIINPLSRRRVAGHRRHVMGRKGDGKIRAGMGIAWMLERRIGPPPTGSAQWLKRWHCAGRRRLWAIPVGEISP